MKTILEYLQKKHIEIVDQRQWLGDKVIELLSYNTSPINDDNIEIYKTQCKIRFLKNIPFSKVEDIIKEANQNMFEMTMTRMLQGRVIGIESKLENKNDNYSYLVLHEKLVIIK